MCVRQSFQININQAKNLTGTSLKTWGTVGNRNWAYLEDDTNNSMYQIEGFKNINLFSVEMVGMVQTNVFDATSAGCIVNDFGMFLNLNGLIPSVSGSINPTPDFYQINPTFKDLCLTKFTNKLTFTSPIQSIRSITFRNFNAQGIAAENLTSISLRYNLTFIFTYEYEGEEY